jgi:putative ABC transport system permease protein
VEIYQDLPNENSYGGALVSRDFVAAQSSLKAFSSVAGFVYDDSGDQNLTGAGDPLRVTIVRVTANLLSVLQVKPSEGRDFLPSEDREGGPAVALLSHRLWQSRFNRDARVIGRSISLGGKAYTVVGVLPAHFVFPDSADEPDVYIPAGFTANTSLATTDLSIDFVQAIARLRKDVTLQQAQAELNVFAENRVKGYAPLFVEWAKGRQLRAQPLQLYLTGDQRTPLLILLACVAAVLLIACANVANLQLARTVAREHEVALRGALGAGRMRVIRQLLVESLTLATAAAALGLLIAAAVTWMIRRGGMPGELSSVSNSIALLQAPFGKLSAAVQINGWVLAFTAGLALITTILFGLTPAIGASRIDLRTALKGSRQISSGRQQRRLRSVLLMAEVGLAVLLLSGAGLLVRSFVNLLRNDSGFDARQALTAQLQRDRSESPETATGFVHQLLPRLQALPGVQAAAIASGLPLGDCPRPRRLKFGDGPPLPYLEQPRACSISVSPQYFHAAGTLVLQGRPFNEGDGKDTAPVAIVNQAFARQFFNGDALGRQFGALVGNNRFGQKTIVGIVQNVRYDGLTEPFQPAIYLPFDQTPQTERVPSLRTILLRTNVPPGSLASDVRKVVSDIDPGQPLFDVETMERRIDRSVAQPRLIMMLIATFAVLALVLAGVGIYGVFTYWVSQRRQEMGIRLALGSSRPGLLRLIFMQAMRVIFAGGVAGMAGAWFLNRMLASMLVGVKVHDPLSLFISCALMTLVALLGTGLPAMGAARTNPASVLHSE